MFQKGTSRAGRSMALPGSREEIKSQLFDFVITWYLLFPYVPFTWDSVSGLPQEWGQGQMGSYLNVASWVRSYFSVMVPSRAVSHTPVANALNFLLPNGFPERRPRLGSYKEDTALESARLGIYHIWLCEVGGSHINVQHMITCNAGWFPSCSFSLDLCHSHLLTTWG